MIDARVHANVVVMEHAELGWETLFGANHTVHAPQNGHFSTPHLTLYSKICFGFTPTPSLYKRILVTHFQNTMNLKKSKNMKRTNPSIELATLD